MPSIFAVNLAGCSAIAAIIARAFEHVAARAS
jgi:hypothetical protein